MQGSTSISKKRNKKGGKKCWYCHSPWHLKQNYPKIRSFYCRQLGHVKAQCNKKKVGYIYNKLMENYKKQDKKNQKKIKETNEKEKKENNGK